MTTPCQPQSAPAMGRQSSRLGRAASRSSCGGRVRLRLMLARACAVPLALAAKCRRRLLGVASDAPPHLDLRRLGPGESGYACGYPDSRAADRGVGRAPPSPPVGFDPRGGPEGAPLRGAKKCPPDPPCGAKPRGGGGAPPTPLILLRNQRRQRQDAARRRAAHAGDTSAPTTPALAGLAGRQTPTRPTGWPHPPRRSASPSRGVRS